MRLHAKAVAALFLGDNADAIFFDDVMLGFGYRLRRGAGGRVLRSWVVQYRRQGDRASRRYLIGSAAVPSAAQAREAARKILGAVALGEDPQADKHVRRNKAQRSEQAADADALAMTIKINGVFSVSAAKGSVLTDAPQPM